MREGLLSNLAGPFRCCGCARGPDGRATATVVSIGDADTIRVIEGGKRSRCAWPAIDAPELAQAPYGEQAPQLSAKPVLKIGSKVQPPFFRPWMLWPHRGRSDRGGQLETGDGGTDGMAFAVPEVNLGPLRREGLSDAEFRASRRRYGVWQAAWRNHQALGLSTQAERSSRICC